MTFPESLFDFLVRSASIQSDIVALRILSLRPIPTLYHQPPKQEQRGNALKPTDNRHFFFSVS